MDIRNNNVYQCANESCETIMVIDDPERLDDPCAKCGFVGKTQIVVVPVCDFCSTNLNTWCWVYPARDFAYSIQFEGFGNHASKGEWAACEDCHALIESDDRQELAVRAVIIDLEREPEYAPMRMTLANMYLSIQGDFFDNRTGEPVFELSNDNFVRKLRRESE